jgi:hypothetical protein
VVCRHLSLINWGLPLIKSLRSTCLLVLVAVAVAVAVVVVLGSSIHFESRYILLY